MKLTTTTEPRMPKLRRLTTRNVVESAIDQSKSDKRSSWESIGKKIGPPDEQESRDEKAAK